MEKPYWEGKHYSYFSNKECEYFPCHKGADPENFNCLFCYCCMHWVINVAGILSLRIRDLRTARIVSCRIRGRIMGM